MKTLKVLSVLLSYPTADLVAAVDELRSALQHEALLGKAERSGVEELIDDLAGGELIDLQERYILLFDRTRSLSLHLFEHVHGESRDRGQAMVDLRSRYEAQGLEIAARELPDYLPLLLEYLSVLPPAQAAEELSQPGVILSALAERLEEKGTPYAAALRILADLAGAGGEAFAIAPADDPDNLAQLDAIWEEEQVRFDAPLAPGAADCPQVAAMVDRMLAQEPVRSPIHG